MPETKKEERLYTKAEADAIAKQLVEHTLADEAKRIEQKISLNTSAFTHIELKAAFNEVAALYQLLLHDISSDKSIN